MSARRGMTLVECLVALVIASVLLSAVELGLLAGQRFARAASASRALRQNLRAGAAVLRGELEDLAPASGDLVAISDSALTVRGQRGVGVICAVPAPGTALLDDSLLSLARPINPAGDSARIFAEGDPLTETDDRWITAAITQVRSAICPSGGSATSLTMSGAAADLAAIDAGAPARIFEIAEYRRYKDAAGTWWLGVRNPSGSGWSATSPIAGPLVPRVGLMLGYLDSALSTTGAPDSVTVVTARLRMLDLASPLADSVLVNVVLKGP